MPYVPNNIRLPFSSSRLSRGEGDRAQHFLGRHCGGDARVGRSLRPQLHPHLVLRQAEGRRGKAPLG